MWFSNAFRKFSDFAKNAYLNFIVMTAKILRGLKGERAKQNYKKTGKIWKHKHFTKNKGKKKEKILIKLVKNDKLHKKLYSFC